MKEEKKKRENISENIAEKKKKRKAENEIEKGNENINNQCSIAKIMKEEKLSRSYLKKNNDV